MDWLQRLHYYLEGFFLGMIDVVNVVDCALTSFVMDCIPSTIVCVASTNPS